MFVDCFGSERNQIIIYKHALSQFWGGLNGEQNLNLFKHQTPSASLILSWKPFP